MLFTDVSVFFVQAAVRAYTSSLEAATADARVWGNRSAAQLHAGNAAAALEDARIARTVDPTYAKASPPDLNRWLQWWTGDSNRMGVQRMFCGSIEVCAAAHHLAIWEAAGVVQGGRGGGGPGQVGASSAGLLRGLPLGPRQCGPQPGMCDRVAIRSCIIRLLPPGP